MAGILQQSEQIKLRHMFLKNFGDLMEGFQLHLEEIGYECSMYVACNRGADAMKLVCALRVSVCV